jgi:isoquinoline 1-oxidoreductase alpha subunit
MIMTTVALLKKTPKPTDADIDAALGGHICRCGTYSRIRKAVHLAAATMPPPAPAPIKGTPKSAPKKGAAPPKGAPAPRKGGAA